jgi:hypothetical protein
LTILGVWRMDQFQIFNLISAGRLGKRWNAVGVHRSVTTFVVAWFVVTSTANQVTSFAVEGPEGNFIVEFEVLCDVEQDFENRHRFANLTMQFIIF